MTDILTGITEALSFGTIAFVILGVFIGNLMGAIPGLNSTMAIAIAIPATYLLSPLVAISFLVGISKGGTIGGSIPAILFNTPGTPEAAVTALDGHPLAKQGKPLKAMKTAVYSSVTGDTMSDLFLILLAAPLAVYTLKMGPVEIAAVVFFSLTVVSSVVGSSILMGFFATFLGLLLSTVGTEVETGTERLTFGSLDLLDGLSLMSVAIGVLVLGEVFMEFAKGRQASPTVIAARKSENPEDNGLSFAEYFALRWTLLRSGLIGTAVGAMPGIGSTIASVVGYSSARRASKTPEAFGKGSVEGIAAAEAANSAVVGANLIPLLTLGIPGNIAAAFLIGAFEIHGMQPGPLMFIEQKSLIYGLFAAMLIANVSNLVVASMTLRMFSYAVLIPRHFVYPVVLCLTLAGGYLVDDGGFAAVLTMIIFGFVGLLFRLFSVPVLPFVIAFVIGGMFELPFRQSIILWDGGVMTALEHPVAIVFVLAGCAVFVRVATAMMRRDRNLVERLAGQD